MKPKRRHTLLPQAAPSVLAGLTAYRLLAGGAWNKIRSRIREQAGARCEICQASYRVRMVCHEVWSYNQKQRLATLKGLRLLCQACNSVTHINVVLRQHPYGVVLVLPGSGPRLELWSEEDADPALRALTHMMRVNQIGVKKAKEMVVRALTHVLCSDNGKWRVKVASHLLCRYPELHVLDGRTSKSRLERVRAGWPTIV